MVSGPIAPDNAAAGIRWEQDLATLFYRSGWTQEELARCEGRGGPSLIPASQRRTPAMTRNIASDPKWIFEVRGGVLLVFGERTDLADGWWFSTNDEPVGPFTTGQAAFDAAADASDEAAELKIVESPTPALPVTDPGEIVPLFGEARPTGSDRFETEHRRHRLPPRRPPTA